MKRIILFLLLFPFWTIAQEKENKWGIGIGYKTNTAVADSIHPIELSLQYRIQNRHTVYLNIPFRIKHYNYTENPDMEERYQRKDNKCEDIIGVGIGYNYGIPIKFDFSAFGGIGLEYLFYSKKKGANLLYEMDDPEHTGVYLKAHQKKNAYSVIPHIGARYFYKHIQAEIKYSLYMSFISGKMDYEVNVGAFYSPPANRYEWIVNGGFTFSLAYFF